MIRYELALRNCLLTISYHEISQLLDFLEIPNNNSNNYTGDGLTLDVYMVIS